MTLTCTSSAVNSCYLGCQGSIADGISNECRDVLVNAEYGQPSFVYQCTHANACDGMVVNCGIDLAKQCVMEYQSGDGISMYSCVSGSLDQCVADFSSYVN